LSSGVGFTYAGAHHDKQFWLPECQRKHIVTFASDGKHPALPFFGSAERRRRIIAGGTSKVVDCCFEGIIVTLTMKTHL
ncbi:hypothetical protein AAGG29_26660, partial [Klebsiella pneumoniae]